MSRIHIDDPTGLLPLGAVRRISAAFVVALLVSTLVACAAPTPEPVGTADVVGTWASTSEGFDAVLNLDDDGTFETTGLSNDVFGPSNYGDGNYEGSWNVGEGTLFEVPYLELHVGEGTDDSHMTRVLYRLRDSHAQLVFILGDPDARRAIVMERSR